MVVTKSLHKISKVWGGGDLITSKSLCACWFPALHYAIGNTQITGFEGMMNKPEFDAVFGSAYVTVNELFSRGVWSLLHTST
jgi:hypothetical protein